MLQHICQRVILLPRQDEALLARLVFCTCSDKVLSVGVLLRSGVVESLVGVALAHHCCVYMCWCCGS
jgi:hypothetical protein